uniref:ATP synthase complex subunit 8 n=1 Tax=Acanthaster planci TaxID=133434 RepID=A0A8D5BHI2_ACAPL|nr:ATP synthase F0 subunit 8 [Acanthaster planci]
MPQLNLAWWLFNFLISWITLLIVFTALLSTPPIEKPTNVSAQTTSHPLSVWTWN